VSELSLFQLTIGVAVPLDLLLIMIFIRLFS
jgi:hypothetical protein